jgi:hypothetical protein
VTKERRSSTSYGSSRRDSVIKRPLSTTSYETKKTSQSTLESEEGLSAFHKAHRRYILKQTRPQSQDEFDKYISKSPIPLDNHTEAL